jgi:CRISPR/Cas system CSM-associated protein Csm3 (group 7 of RAMP superfamily)
MTPYRTLIFARLIQESALSVGGNRPHAIVDMPLARDGLGRPVLRGTTLAGLFIASARERFGQLPETITCPFPEKQHVKQEDQEKEQPLIPSAWRFAHAHLLGDVPTGFFQHVSIDPRTGAAKDDHLFDLEAVARGAAWAFQLELVPPKGLKDWALIEGIAARILEDWSAPGGIRIGHGSRHGYGWAHLEDVRIVRLRDADWSLWPDALAEHRTADDWLAVFRQHGLPVLDLPAFLQQTQAPAEQPRGRVTLSGTVEIGPRQDRFGAGYGVDSLSIGGHAQLDLQAKTLFERLLQPPHIKIDKDKFDPDFTITLMPTADGTLEPYLPGASLRGVWRAALERHLNATGGDPTLIETLFGSTDRAGALAISDGMLESPYQVLWQQHVAIDEFTGGAYGAAKFDRLSLIQARFRWRAVITAPTQADADAYAEPLRRLLTCLGDGHLPLGGGVWRGHGHVRWQLDNTPVTEAA